tara:strand:- start:1003 stop:1155 length:153 start_codon:yes stop_codon:yes gene_type:complete
MVKKEDAQRALALPSAELAMYPCGARWAFESTAGFMVGALAGFFAVFGCR